MKIKVGDVADPTGALLAVYEADHVPARGDALRLPGDEGVLWVVESRVWFPAFDEVLIAVRLQRARRPFRFGRRTGR